MTVQISGLKKYSFKSDYCDGIIVSQTTFLKTNFKSYNILFPDYSIF